MDLVVPLCGLGAARQSSTSHSHKEQLAMLMARLRGGARWRVGAWPCPSCPLGRALVARLVSRWAFAKGEAEEVLFPLTTTSWEVSRTALPKEFPKVENTA